MLFFGAIVKKKNGKEGNRDGNHRKRKDKRVKD
jgi:hypothetical protein